MILSGNEDSPCDKQGEFDELSINKIKKKWKFFHVCRKGNLWSSFHSLRGQVPRPAAAETSLGDAEYIDADQAGGD